MSRVSVMCHVSRVTCHMSHVFFLFFFLQSGEVYRWMVCYQRSLPHLVYIIAPSHIVAKSVFFVLSFVCPLPMQFFQGISLAL